MKAEKYCNMCGKKIAQKQEEHLCIQKEWGYFSEMDQKGYRFRICEHCFENLIGQFKIPAEVYEQTELM